VNKITQSHYGEPVARWAYDAISRPDQSEYESPLAPGATLIIVVLSSLGLWAIIWLTVSLLASGLA